MFVIDASVAVQLLLPQTHSVHAEALVNAALVSDEIMTAPPLFFYEVANAMFQWSRRTGAPVTAAISLLQHLERYSIRLPSSGLHHRAIELAAQYRLPATCDAHYLALAEQLACDFWTDDQRLLNTLGGALPAVRALGSFTPA